MGMSKEQPVQEDARKQHGMIVVDQCNLCMKSVMHRLCTSLLIYSGHLISEAKNSCIQMTPEILKQTNETFLKTV